MNTSVDLTNLHEMTGNDAALEKELFHIFLVTAAESITILRNSCEPDATEAWRKAAHALKGISLNLGAEALGKLCQDAQENAAAAPDKKHATLTAIEAEHMRVEEFLTNL